MGCVGAVMNLRQIGDFLFGRRVPAARQSPAPVAGGVVGGATARLTDTQYFDAYFSPIVARAGVQTSYADLSEEALNQLSDDQVRKMIRGASPTVAAAIAQFADWCASGFTYTADTMIDDGSRDSPAQKLIDEFIHRQERDFKGLEGFVRVLARDMFTHGAAFSELVFDDDAQTPLYAKPLDATTAVFRRQTDPVLGEYYELGQDWSWGADNPRRNGSRPRSTLIGSSGYLNFVSLHDNPTIKYAPLQGESNYPYGVPVLDPAVFHVVASAGFFNAFKQAITANIWPGYLFGIDKEKFKLFAGASADPKVLEAKLDALAKDVLQKIGKLKPGGALVYGDELQITAPLTGQGRVNFGQMLKDVHDILRRETIIAVQSQPILMGSNEAIAETHANLQLVIYGKLIRNAQKTLNLLVTDYLNLILDVNGYPQLANFRLNYQNTAEYREQALTFKQFREGLQVASQDLLHFVEALQAAVSAGFMTPEVAQEAFNEGMQLRRELNILPQEL